jgi:hypothetical protein
MKDYIIELIKRLIECADLSIAADKLVSVKTLLERHAAELLENVENSTDADLIKSKFSNFINKALSTIEALGLNDAQYKAIRKLFLSEINGCLDLIIKKNGKEKPEKKEKKK